MYCGGVVGSWRRRHRSDALLLKIRAELAIDTPRTLSSFHSGERALAVPFAIWWYRFDREPAGRFDLWPAWHWPVFISSSPRLYTSAALLSFRFEAQRVPASIRKPRTIPLAAAGRSPIAILVLSAYAAPGIPQTMPQQVVTTPTRNRVATPCRRRPHLRDRAVAPRSARQFASTASVRSIPAGRPRRGGLRSVPAWPAHRTAFAHRWRPPGRRIERVAEACRAPTSVRTAWRRDRPRSTRTPSSDGTPPRLRLGDLRGRARSVARRQLVDQRSSRSATVTSIGQEMIFSRDPLNVDATATRRFSRASTTFIPQFATVFSPRSTS